MKLIFSLLLIYCIAQSSDPLTMILVIVVTVLLVGNVIDTQIEREKRSSDDRP